MWWRLRAAAVSVLVVGVNAAACAEAPVPQARPAASAPLLAAVAYRGEPVGTPRMNDVAAIRASDFVALAWPRALAVNEARDLAASVSLQVVDLADLEPLTPASALEPDAVVTIDTGAADRSVEALAWRAIAHGARTVVFDSGAATGSGFTDAAGGVREWVGKARAVSRQLTFNRTLLEAMRPFAPVVWVEPRPSSVDVAVLETNRSWLLVATNTAATPIRAIVRVPPPLPPALWVDLLDGTEMSMLNLPEGPQWTFDLGPDGVRVYAIDKQPAR